MQRTLARRLRVLRACRTLAIISGREVEVPDHRQANARCPYTNCFVDSPTQVGAVSKWPQTQDGIGGDDRQTWHERQLLPKLHDGKAIDADEHDHDGRPFEVACKLGQLGFGVRA